MRWGGGGGGAETAIILVTMGKAVSQGPSGV